MVNEFQAMRSNHPHLFFSRKEKACIVGAMVQAEKETSGEIRVHLARKVRGDVLTRARETFEKIGMIKTIHQNGVLIFLSIQDRSFAIVGDVGIHEKLPPDFWDRMVQEAAAHFRVDRFADGVVHAVLAAGEKLKVYFPRGHKDVNELPDRISYSI